MFEIQGEKLIIHLSKKEAHLLHENPFLMESLTTKLAKDLKQFFTDL